MAKWLMKIEAKGKYQRDVYINLDMVVFAYVDDVYFSGDNMIAQDGKWFVLLRCVCDVGDHGSRPHTSTYCYKTCDTKEEAEAVLRELLGIFPEGGKQ